MSKQTVYQKIDELEPLCKESCQFLWNHPEVGGTEKESAAYMRSVLSKEGFVIVNEEKLEHAFYAEYGSGHPVIAILGEYDALPGLSQNVCADRNPVEKDGPGHGCGHNMLGSASLVAAIALKHMIEEEKLTGTIRYYGCPEEELLSGKVKMAYYGMFNGCDLALSWHPGVGSMVVDRGYLACAYAKFYFSGISSHAAFAPEAGRSAMDAVELMNVGANYLREHVISSARIHYSSDNCGFPPNIVPSEAVAWYAVRAPRMSDVRSILDRIEKIAQGAAMMTETTVRTEIQYGCCELYPNKAFADLTYQNMLDAPRPVYTDEEIELARGLQASVNPAMVAHDKEMFDSDEVLHSTVARRDLCKDYPITASSDAGDVSYIMPMNSFTVPTWPLGVAPHTWQATAGAGSSFGMKGTLYAARIIAATAYDLMTKPELTQQILKEFADAKIDYTPMYTE